MKIRATIGEAISDILYKCDDRPYDKRNVYSYVETTQFYEKKKKHVTKFCSTIISVKADEELGEALYFVRL